MDDYSDGMLTADDVSDVGWNYAANGTDYR